MLVNSVVCKLTQNNFMVDGVESLRRTIPGVGGGGGIPIHYLYGYVPPNGVVILKQPFEIIQGQIAFKNTVQVTV